MSGPPAGAAPFRRGHPLIERWRRTLIGPWLARLGYDFEPAVPEWEHRPLSAREVGRLIGEAAAALSRDFAAAGIAPRGESVEAIVRAFWDLIPRAPVRQRHGGNGFNGALLVYAVARALAPAVIVESGVFRGLTTWVLRQACPDARLICFDPVLAQRVHVDPAATYSGSDWSAFDFAGIDLQSALGFFDDHIDQGRRILEAQARGMKTLLFDDDAAAHRIHTHGGPAHPTVAMLFDKDSSEEAIRWLRNGREFVYRPDRAVVGEVRAAVRAVQNFDDLHRATGYSPARMTFVRLTEKS